MSNFYEVKDPFAAGRDCRHGQLARSCEICELTAQLSGLQAKYDAAIIGEILEERRRQDAKWGEQNHPDGTGDQVKFVHGEHLASDGDGRITMGTISYVSKYVTDLAAANGKVTFADILVEEIFEALCENDPERVRAELIQSAAVIVAWVEAIDRRTVLSKVNPKEGRSEPIEQSSHHADLSKQPWAHRLVGRSGSDVHA